MQDRSSWTDRTMPKNLEPFKLSSAGRPRYWALRQRRASTELVVSTVCTITSSGQARGQYQSSVNRTLTFPFVSLQLPFSPMRSFDFWVEFLKPDLQPLVWASHHHAKRSAPACVKRTKNAALVHHEPAFLDGAYSEFRPTCRPEVASKEPRASLTIRQIVRSHSIPRQSNRGASCVTIGN